MKNVIILFLLILLCSSSDNDIQIGQMTLFLSENNEYYIKYKGRIPDCEMKEWVNILYDCDNELDSFNFENETHILLDSFAVQPDTCKPQRKTYKI